MSWQGFFGYFVVRFYIFPITSVFMLYSWYYLYKNVVIIFEFRYYNILRLLFT